MTPSDLSSDTHARVTVVVVYYVCYNMPVSFFIIVELYLEINSVSQEQNSRGLRSSYRS